MSEEYEDAADYLNDLSNRRAYSGEKVLLWEILWKTYLDLNIITYRTRCLAFLESDHFQQICTLLDLKHEQVKTALLSARPPKPTMRGKRGGRKKQPIVWAATFNSLTIGATINDEHTATL